MSQLEFLARPWVVFDPRNKDHRRWYAEFVHSRTWGHCPVRFVVADDHGDLITMIQRSLVKFYVEREFGVNNGLDTIDHAHHKQRTVRGQNSSPDAKRVSVRGRKKRN